MDKWKITDPVPFLHHNVKRSRGTKDRQCPVRRPGSSAGCLPSRLPACCGWGWGWRRHATSRRSCAQGAEAARSAPQLSSPLSLARECARYFRPQTSNPRARRVSLLDQTAQEPPCRNKAGIARITALPPTSRQGKSRSSAVWRIFWRVCCMGGWLDSVITVQLHSGLILTAIRRISDSIQEWKEGSTPLAFLPRGRLA